jgi:hypothetical protein
MTSRRRSGKAARHWWSSQRLGWTVAVVVLLRLATIAAFRSRQPAVLDPLRQANKKVLNPLMLHLAGKRHWYAAKVEHVGRRSGRHHETPVVAVPVEGGLAIPLPYGEGWSATGVVIRSGSLWWCPPTGCAGSCPPSGGARRRRTGSRRG